jgi:tight adherence protein B
MITILLAVAGAVACAALVRGARHADARTRARDAARDSRKWRVPRRIRPRLVAALDAADRITTPEAAVQTWASVVLGVAVVAAAVAPALVAPAVIVALVGGPVVVHAGRRRAEQRFARALPAVLEQVAAELRGGGTVAGAVERLGRADAPTARDLARVHARTRLGLGFTDALVAWPAERPVDGVRAAAGALSVAATLGGRAADALDGLASSLRHRLDAVDEARALSAQARLSAIVVGVAPVGYLVFAGMVDPASVDTLVGTAVGRVCLMVGLVLDGLGALWIRRIVRSEA